jgi:hypothetical protein
LLTALMAAADQFVTVAPDVRLFIRTVGTGSPVMVLHGGPGLDSNYLAANPFL